MAKRKQKPARLGHITAIEVDKAERLMDWQLNEILEAKQQHDIKKEDFERHLFTGMAQMVYALGIKCSCHYSDPVKNRPTCLCSRTESGLKDKIIKRTGQRPRKPEITFYWR